MGLIENFEAMLARGQDSALLRHGLGTAYLNQNDHDQAIVHLAEAVRLDPSYSAAWKLYGRALASSGRYAEAVAALDRGIAVATAKGDVQASKEMQVFRRRAMKSLER